MTGHVSIRLASERVNHCVASLNELPRFYTPGEVITGVQDFMRGHGTYIEDEYIKSAVAGVMQKVNKLICVTPLKSRYVGEIGDVVVGRILEVQQRRWKVETNSRLESRRRSAEDEQTMRKHLQEGDLISAEVQNIKSDGTLSLHTRTCTRNFDKSIPFTDKPTKESLPQPAMWNIALVSSKVMLDDTSIMFAYEESLKYENVKEILDPEAMFDIFE
ncbi:Exosome complex exonuclease RRP4 [Operophtera brumata]|uniref:Exosome complex exonuclease RRP4 n=1 Tax=Operophtera brumata TaxID=104452 RepID=A0A0L7KWS9_OPEBR|nr:Exosome complex exonuclease RRP4 [Operophtera brumata]